MLSVAFFVVMLSVVMLSVVAPFKDPNLTFIKLPGYAVSLAELVSTT
jgi:hypothetical protein